jgi:putative SOS response-associated peptidase YedK
LTANRIANTTTWGEASAIRPAILRPQDYDRWLGPEPDPRELLAPFPVEPMTMWPISKRVNSPQNDDEDLLAEIQLPAA